MRELVRKVLTERERLELSACVQLSTSPTIVELVAAYLKHARTYYVKVMRDASSPATYRMGSCSVPSAAQKRHTPSSLPTR